jgi:hypothetical protein
VGMVGSMLSRDPKNPMWDPDVLVSLLFLGHFHTTLAHLHKNDFRFLTTDK